MKSVIMLVLAVRHGLLVLVEADTKAEHVGKLSVVTAALVEWGWSCSRTGAFLWAPWCGFGPLLGDGEGGP